MESQAVPQAEITASLSKAEQIKLHSLEDKVLHYDPQNPFLAIIGADTDRLIAVFASYLASIFPGEKKQIPYSAPFNISAITYAAGNALQIIELPLAANKDKMQVAENLLFYRDVVLQKNMKIIVLCSTDIFNELHSRSMDFVSMSLETMEFSDFKAVKEEDFKDSDTLAAAKKALQDKIDELEKYKRQLSDVNGNFFLEKLDEAIRDAIDLSELDIAIRLSYDMENYAKNLLPSYELQAMTRLGSVYFQQGNISQSSAFINKALQLSELHQNKQKLTNLLNTLGSLC
jgi:hypothetical protein